MTRFIIDSVPTLNQFLKLEEHERAKLTEIYFDSMDFWLTIMISNDKKTETFYNLLSQCSERIQTISESPNKGVSMLWLAAYYRQWDLINILFEYARQEKYCLHIDRYPLVGVDRGTTPFWWSVYPGSKETVELLLSKGANIDAGPPEGKHKGETPLWRAAYYRCWDIVRLIIAEAEKRGERLNFNASPLKGQNQGSTSLWWAAYDKQWDVVALMIRQAEQTGYYLDFDASPAEGQHKGKTVLGLAQENGNDEMFNILLSKGATFNPFNWENLIKTLNSELDHLSFKPSQTSEKHDQMNDAIEPPVTKLKFSQDNCHSERSSVSLPAEEKGEKLLLGFKLKKDTTEVKTNAQPALQGGAERRQERRPRHRRAAIKTIHYVGATLHKR